MTTSFGSPAWLFAGLGNARATLRISDPGFPTAPTLFVDATHDKTADTNTGLDPNWPLTTVQQAVDNITRAGTTIAIAPGTYAEAIAIPVTYDNCRMIGMGSNPYQVQVGQTSGTGTYSIQVAAQGWEFANMLVWARGGAGHLGGFNLLGGDNASYTTAAVAGESQYTHIHDCVIRGTGSPDQLISLDGAPWYVTIENNLFIQVTGTGGCGIKVINTSNSVPQKNLIKNNVFQAMGDDGAGYSYYGETKYSMFIGNIFGNGFGADALFLNVDGLGGAGAGTYNVFAGNFFCANSGGTQEFDTTNIVATANTNAWAGNYTLALGGASDTATYGVQHVEPDAAA